MVDIANHWSYDLLKQLAAEEGQSVGTAAELDEIKGIFEIDSLRRKTCIQSVPDLIDYLERQDILSEHNVEPLHELASLQGSERLMRAVQEYVPPELPSANQNQYQLERLSADMRQKIQLNAVASPPPPKQQNTSLAMSHAQQLASPPPSQASTGKCAHLTVLTAQQRSTINKMIAKHLGSYWRSLGRELDICEGDMDAIELRFPRDLRSRIHAMLEHFAEDDTHSPNDEVLLLCRALDNCARKDLRRQVEEILQQL